ncbi:MAG: nucleoside triphosphate pyrophosphatase [Candidatus Saccharimonadales bacterium]|nr:nucleoside triphosphate pyrophosphatase [Candidatus Saccharimonadales bacterium]
MRKLILASKSPRRKAALSKVGAKFEVIVSNYEEDMMLDMPPNELVQHLARGKAEDVARKHPDAIVIGVDSVVVCNGQLIGKPKNMEAAKEQIRLLADNEHQFITGYVIVSQKENKIVTNSVMSTIKFVQLSDDEIDAYLSEGEPLGKAGAYSYEDKGDLLIERRDGANDLSGLPAGQLGQDLKQFGINLLTGQY